MKLNYVAIITCILFTLAVNAVLMTLGVLSPNQTFFSSLLISMLWPEPLVYREENKSE